MEERYEKKKSSCGNSIKHARFVCMLFFNTNEYDTEVVSDNEVCDEEAFDYMKGDEYWESFAKND